MNGHNRPASRPDFQVAIISALPLENNAVLCSLDEHWDDANHVYGRAEGDPIQYRFGRCGGQPVVIVILHKIGMEAASTAAQSLRMSFPSINLVLLVGVCGAVPWTPDDKKTEIVLGDVIVSEVLVQLDNIRQYPHGTQRRQDTIYDSPMKPSEEVIGLLQCLKTQAELNRLRKKMMDNLGELLRKPAMDTICPPVSEDKLFEPNYIHRHHSGCPECSTSESVCNAALKSSCDAIPCDDARLIRRDRLLAQADGAPSNHMIHFGSIGTGNVVMKSAEHRDKWAETEKVIGFEMEGAGIWNKFNCLIIKGVCDYADSHKNKKWQKYAAAVAASVAKGVLGYYAPHDRRSQSGTPDSRFELSSRTSSLSRSRLDPQSLGLVDDSLPREIFNRIFNGFERQFDSNKVNVYRTTDLRILKRELKHIQNEQARTRTLRNLRRIEPFIVKFEQYGVVLQSILGTAELMGFIWGPVKELVQKAKAQVDTFDALLTAYEEIGEALPSFEDQLGTFRQNVGLQRILARIFVDVTEFHHNALRIYLGGALKALFKSLWKDFNPTYESIILRIQSHARMIEDKARASYSHLGQYEMDMREIRDYLREKEKETRDCQVKETARRKKEIDDVQGWIGGAESYTQHQDICRDRNTYRGSGSWILDQEKVQDWLSTDPEEYSSLLWINGHPGTGKTYLASVIIDACMERSAGETCYFYCNEKFETKSSGLSVLRGILLQLIPKDEDLVPYCLSKKKGSHTSNISDLSTAQTLIETFCERVPRLNVVIDGLDECEEARKDLLEVFKYLMKKAEDSSPGKLRILLLSRPLPEIRSAIPNASVIALEPENTMEDIRNYCQQRRARELEKFRSEEWLVNKAVDTICIKSNGMFLFARLVMDNLQKQSTIADFKKEISPTILPGELHDAYARIMERLKRDLSPGQLKYTRLLLGWLVYAKRPLKWTEIQVALSIDMGDLDTNELDMELRICDEPEELCGSLVQKLKGNRFELIHSTARQFIENTDYINWRTAECDLAVRCLRYLTLDLFKPDISERTLRKYARRGDLAFQDYAVASWYRHIRTLIDKKAAFLGASTMQIEYNTPSQVDTVTQELDNFVAFYADAFPHLVPDQALQDCVFFQRYPFYGKLARVWGHIYTTQNGDLEARNSVGIPMLKETLTRNRELLEKLSEEPQMDFVSLYDDHPFRCPKVMCFYFHQGFKGSAMRQEHNSQHDLPYRCKDETCERSTLGFRSNNELAAHEKRYHPSECDPGDSFVNIHRREVSPTKYECKICHKFFVRRNILEDHIRSHNGERPFCCSECGKGFARKWDMTRHEKTVHERGRR